MTKTKKKSVIIAIAVFFFSVCVMVLFGTEGGAVAYAATTPRYAVSFSYTCTYKYNTSSSVVSSGTSTSANVMNSSGGSTTISIEMYGSSASGSDTFTSGSTINSSTVNIAVTSGYAWHKISVVNSSGTEVGKSESKTIALSGLADGTYNFTCAESGMGWNPNPRSYASYSTDLTFSFVVDTTAPSVNGASTSTTGKYTNSVFTVSASDNIALENLYMMAPDVSNYSAVGTSKTVTAGSVNGLYRFYAKDKAGNKSSTYYVYYDNTKPTGVIKTESGTTISGGYTKTAFYYTATDAGGIDYLQYKTPSIGSWMTYTSGTVIAATTTNGKYYFRAVDKGGNISDEKSIVLDTVIPTGTLYGGTTIISSGGITNANYIKFIGEDRLSGISAMYVKVPNSLSYDTYTSGTQYSVDGLYSFYCVDNAGNASATYTILLDKTAPTLTCTKTSFYSTYEYGFTVSANDTAGTVKLYYKTPTASTYTLASSASYSVTEAMANGKYYFYAEDEAGNQSSTVWIELNIVYPEAEKIESPTDNSVCYTWSGNNTAKLNGNDYTKGTWIKTEGTYTLVVTNIYGRSTTYTFSVGHYYSLKQTVAATCESQGYKLYECSHCGLSYKTDYVAAEGHKYIKTTTEPSCLEQGYTIYSCSACGNTYTSDYTMALGHNYIETIVESTCTKEGCIEHTCSRCDDNYKTDNIPALGHKYIETEVIATCTEDGCLKHTCAVCGFEYKTNVVEATGHSYLTEVTMVATCTENGERCHICDKCADSYTKVIPATGHTYEITEVHTDDGKTVREYTCSTCGDQYVQELGDQYEHVSNYVEHLFELYAPYMWWTLLATAGVWSVAMGIAIIIAKKNEDKEKAKKMVVNYVVGLVIIAAIVVACPYLIKGIAYLVT